MAGFDDFFDAYGGAFLRADGVVVGAYAEPTVFVLPDRTVVCRTHAEVAAHLTEERRRLLADGVRELSWSALEARPTGPAQHVVTVRWDHAETDTVYVLRGTPPDALVAVVVTSG